ncbi:magnesium transporter MgtE N-terminal domain-containing protein [Mangrovihabitans endophyticus]|nr:hypothetical protein [Mangrovihabitans endophyticus]
MPTEHLVTMLAASPPQRAVQVLMSMPVARRGKLLAAMNGPLLARLLLAADADRRAALLTLLDDDRLAAELASLPPADAAAVLAAMPADRTAAQLRRVPSEHLTTLLEAVDSPQREHLVRVLDPERLTDLRRIRYEKAVIESLRRTSAELSWVPQDTGSNLFAVVFQRVFGISLCHVDTPPLPAAAVIMAHQLFAKHRVDGVLAVTNAVAAPFPPLDPPPTHVLTWAPDDTDGVLARALVRLAG